MILTVPCPVCRSGLIDLRAVRQEGALLGWRSGCSDCKVRTDLSATAQEAIDLFRRAKFL